MEDGMDVEPSELEQRLRQQALLAEIGRRALAGTDWDTLIQEATRLCALGLGTRFCKVLKFLPDQNRFLVSAGVGWREGVVGHLTIGAELDSPAGYALHTGKPVISNHLSREDRFRTPDLLAAHGVQRALNVILSSDARPYGVLEVDSQDPGAFSENDVDFLQSVANLLGLALDRQRAEKALRHLNEHLENRVAAELAERRQAENALRQAQKMEAVGQLTGGVAHDFNNLLLVITGNLDLLARAVAGNERLEQLVATAQKGATRGAQLTSQLLAFARRQTLRPEVRPINVLVREFDVLATRMLGEAIEVSFVLAPDAGACDVDPAQFGSALLNLVVNARDAMPDGGRLLIRTSNCSLDSRAAAQHSEARPGQYVVVEVTDSGTGMSPEVAERAMEPFYTTKQPGQGTGLGLSQVYGFVRQSEGIVLLESAPGVGTTVRIHLPQAAAAVSPRSPAPQMPSGSGRVLVVEDDALVRDLVAAQLEDLGYETVSAGSGPEALQILSSGDFRIDLMLTDMVMPGGMSGAELIRQARKRQPDLRVVLTSGYVSGSIPAGSGEVPSDIPMLSKPYRQMELARIIQQELEKRV
jgi:signal transduction histidine kinase